MLVVDTDEVRLTLTVTQRVGMDWYHSLLSSTINITNTEHCRGTIQIDEIAGVKYNRHPLDFLAICLVSHL